MAFLDTSTARDFSGEKPAKIPQFQTEHLGATVLCVAPGQRQKPHTHDDSTKFYYVMEGEGAFTVGDEIRTMGPGGLIVAEPGVTHGVENRSGAPLVLLVAMSPPPEPRG